MITSNNNKTCFLMQAQARYANKDYTLEMIKQYKLDWTHVTESKLLALQATYDSARFAGGLAALTMGSNFIIIPI